MRGCMFGATQNYVSNCYLPEVVWDNLFLPVSFDNAM